MNNGILNGLLASNSGFLYGFLTWFKAFFGNMLSGLLSIFKGLFDGIVQIFNFPYYFRLWATEGSSFGALDWILSILAFILAFAVWAGIIFLIVIGIRKLVRLGKTAAKNEDLLEELSDLQSEVNKLTEEKERIIRIKVTQAGLSYEQMKKTLEEEMKNADETASGEDGKSGTALGACRFQRLAAVDEKYAFFQSPSYDDPVSLKTLCEDIRNYACYNNGLYYDIRTIRLTIAGFAATKLLILQGISGTGKTSLPYVMGKFFKNDATIASVQPSWRDRNELFGYFNEFTKKFNETEVLRRIYEAGYNDDLNLIILDEMNIARVEYYFAEMLSVLEMPDPNEWKIELVPSSWNNDPARLDEGNLKIPQNVWYVGTINNDDSTFSVSDKVYDRAFVINLDNKGIPFDAPATSAKMVSYGEVEALYEKAEEEFAVSEDALDKIGKLDNYVIDKFRIAFGNRIMKQLKRFVPVYVACGGNEAEGVDYILATKVFRKFESLNLSLIRDEIRPLVTYLDSLFGKGVMKESINYLLTLQKMY